MDFAKRQTDEPLLTTADLVAREDFTLGGVIVSPSTRTLRGPDGATDIEPRVMQVMVVLAEAAGQVVTRETLFNRCWGGVYVGDDSLNRAVAAVRRAVAAVGGRFEIETIPRTGYRLMISRGDSDLALQIDDAPVGFSRRQLAGGAVAIIAAGGLAGWSVSRSRTDRRFEAIIQNAQDAARRSAFDEKTARSLEEAVSLRPDSAKAWGMLALVRSVAAPGVVPKEMPGAVEQAESAAGRALAIDPNQPDALLAMFELQGSTLDWATRDQRLRRIIAIDPNNIVAMAELVLLLQAAGMTRESWNWNERALARNPLSVDFLSKRAMKLWIVGRVSDADKVIDQVRALYPTDPWPRFVRFMIFALSGRPRAAQAMLEPSPRLLDSPMELRLWQTSLTALDQPSAENGARAREACFEGAKAGGGLASQGVMLMSALDDVDAAFDIANGFLLSRGSIVRRGEPKSDLSDATWRVNTQWLFTPACAAMRRDPRFLPLCDAMGLGDYWHRRRVEPDYLQR